MKCARDQSLTSLLVATVGSRPAGGGRKVTGILPALFVQLETLNLSF